MKFVFPTFITFLLMVFQANAETVELKIVPTFHTPLIIKAELNQSSGFISVCRYQGQGGYDWGAIDIEYKKKIDPIEVSLIRDELEGLGFWKQPSKVDDLGVDGSIWILSVVDGEKKHEIRRWSPQSDTEERGLVKLRDFGFFLSDFCGIHPIYGEEIKSSDPVDGGQ